MQEHTQAREVKGFSKGWTSLGSPDLMDAVAPLSAHFAPQAAPSPSLSLNLCDFDQLVTKMRVLIYQILTREAAKRGSTLARSTTDARSHKPLARWRHDHSSGVWPILT